MCVTVNELRTDPEYDALSNSILVLSLSLQLAVASDVALTKSKKKGSSAENYLTAANNANWFNFQLVVVKRKKKFNIQKGCLGL